MPDHRNSETESERIAREQGSKAHSNEKHRKQAGQHKEAPTPADKDRDQSGQI